ncbi:MAG: DUF7743 domain-containing protein [Candidatus Hodarchaeales archaeon]|jgi:hypothetical protein
MNKKYIKKKLVYPLLLLFLFVLIQPSNIQAEPTADTNPPDLHGLIFDKSVASLNESFTIFANITDDSSGVNYADAYLYGPLNNYRGSVGMWYNATIGLYQGTYTFTNQFWPTGVYYVYEISTEDNANNYRSYYNGTDFMSPKIALTGTTPDLNPPVLNNIFFDRTSVTVNESFIIFANITDDFSGISYVDAYLYGPLNNYRGSVGLWYNTTTGLYQGTFTFFNEFWPLGNYYAYEISTEDNANNYRSFYNGTDFISPTVSFSGSTPDSNHPKLEGFYFDRFSVNVNESFTIYANITDDISGISYVDAYIYGPLNNYRGSVGLWYNATTGLYQGTFVFYNANWPTGNYYLYEISTEDNANNYMSYYNGSDFLSPTVLFNSTTSPQNLTANTDIVNWASYSDLWYVSISTSDYANATVYIDYNYYTSMFYFTSTVLIIDTKSYSNGLHNFTIDVYDENDFISLNYFVYFNNSVISQPFNFWTNIVHNGNYTGYLNVDFNTDILTNVSVFLDGAHLGTQTYSNVGTFPIDTPLYTEGFHVIAFEIVDVFNFTNRFNTNYSVYFYNTLPNNYISLSLDRYYGTSIVGENASLRLNLESTFDHDIPNVWLELSAWNYEMTYSYTLINNFYLPANSVFSFDVIFQFSDIGEFNFTVILWDDINIPWSSPQGTWIVYSEDNTTTTTPESTDISSTIPINSTTPDNSTDSESSRLTITTSPGFEFIIMFVALIGVLGYRTKKNKN